MNFKSLFSDILLCILFVGKCVGMEKECGEKIYSTPTEKRGVLSSINHPNHYPENVKCLYFLVGRPDERVEIVFTQFEVIGVPPRCVHDYIDIYTQLRSVDENLLNAPLQGRFCGKDKDSLPYLIRSVSNILLVGLYTDATREEKGFQLHYAFISDAIYNVGRKVPQHLCGSIIDEQKSGIILSPTYPGVYPDNITCFYKFHGEEGERIKLVFNDVDMYFGGRHCPFDYIKVFDGPTNEAHVIDTICGRHSEPEVIFSTGSDLQVYFVTKTGRKSQLVLEETEEDITTQLKGFNASFEIGRQFVNLSLISEGTHLEGTECDRLIRSQGQNKGMITSPYYPNPYPVNVTCHYFVDGLIDKQDLENVRLHILEFNVGNPPDENATIGHRCRSGFLQVYSQKSSIARLLDRKDSTSPPVPDFEYCGQMRTKLPNITTDNPRLVLIFDTHNAKPQARGFKVKYEFQTDYAIPGTPVNQDARCHFLYSSASSVLGTFNSPRHPSFYPNGTYCIYEFHGSSDEVVRITFENFQVEDHPNCSKDYVDIFKVIPSTRLEEEREQVQVGHYCGERFPGPQDEDSQILKVVLHSDDEGVRKGFRAKYEFLKRQPLLNKCFKNETAGGSGVIKSPNYPHKYTTNITCEWTIWGRSRLSRILMTFDIFSIEGNPFEKIGCANAVLKIYTTRGGMPAHEMCGENRSIENLQIISQTNVLRLKFVSSAKATGGKGFRLPWTELLPLKGGRCSGFRCEKTHYCISNSLKCDGIPNCGRDDTSDETKECLTYRDGGAINITMGVVGFFASLLLLAGGAWWYHKKKSEKKNTSVARAAPKPLNKNLLNGGPLLKEKTEKVSMV